MANIIFACHEKCHLAWKRRFRRRPSYFLTATLFQYDRSRKDDFRGHFNIFTSPSFRHRLWYSTRKAIFVLALRFYFCSNWKVSFSSFFSHLGCASARKSWWKWAISVLAKIRRPASTKILSSSFTVLSIFHFSKFLYPTFSSQRVKSIRQN